MRVDAPRPAVVRFAIALTALAASPFLELIAGTRAVRILRVCIQSAGSTDLLTIARRTAVLTGGTSAAITFVANDSNQPAVVATGKTYSVASTGGGDGAVTLATVNCLAAVATPLDFNNQSMVINPTQTLTLQMGAATAIRGFIEFEEIYS